MSHQHYHVSCTANVIGENIITAAKSGVQKEPNAQLKANRPRVFVKDTHGGLCREMTSVSGYISNKASNNAPNFEPRWSRGEEKNLCSVTHRKKTHTEHDTILSQHNVYNYKPLKIMTLGASRSANKIAPIAKIS